MKYHSAVILRWRSVLSCALLLFSCAALAQQPVRQSVSAHVPTAARLALPVTRMAAAERLSLAISLPFRNREALSNLLQQINDPASPDYRHYLTREEFTERFGPTEEDFNALRRFAMANGFRINAEHANRMLLEVNGTVADIERTFHTTLGVYRHPTEARTFYAPSAEPSLDLTVPVLSVGGLDNFALARPHLQIVSTSAEPNASPNLGSAPNGAYRGSDFRAAYVPNTTLTGSGQIVGLLQFDGYTTSDITYYESQAGLPSVTLSNILLSGASGAPSHDGGEVEVSLDIEAAIAMAPGLAQVMVYEAPNPSPFETILNRMVSDNAAKQLSCSWFIPGGAAHPAADQAFQEMALQGQTFFNASGDDDAFTGLLDFPGDSPYITQVGGTTLTTANPGGARVSETVWNRGNGIGSGGGISTQYGIPTWQTNISMSNNQGSTTMRNVPDVALTGDNVYVRANGSDLRVSGTSCSAPLWAGFAALANQKAVASGQPTIGFINQTVDTIGSSPSYASCFFDITTGNNTKSSSPTKFFATTGYDLCTGWGTPAGQNLIDALANSEPLQVTPETGFTSTGGVGGPFTVTSQNLSLTNPGTNALNWTLVNSTPWLSASPTSGTINTGAVPTIVAVSLNTAASNLTAGTYNGSLYVSNIDSHASFERDYSLVIIDPPSVATQPTNQSVLDGATATFSAGVTGGLPLFYRWRLNGTNVFDGGDFTGAATATLTISNVSVADTGIYTLFITNAAGTTTSSNALLSIVDSQPVIVIQPTNQTVNAGLTATFSVTALGDEPLYYQWNYGGPGGTNINGATNATLILSNVQPADAGLYSVTVSNSLGVAMSSYATLTIIQVPVIKAFSPAAGTPGTNVSIVGLNFSSSPASNIVYFGAVRALVVSASTTNLVATVPHGATYSPITVTVNGLTAYANQPFLPIFPGSGQITSSSLGPRIDLGAGNGPIRVSMADLNNDGRLDLVVASALDGAISIYQNVNTNSSLAVDSFAPRIKLSTLSPGGASPYGLAIADLDGDGKLDIIVIDADNNLVSIFRNIGVATTITSNSFAPRVDLPAGPVMRGMAIKDLNADGKADIVTANYGDNTISVFENQSTQGNISFANRINFNAALGPFGVAIADIDGDGNSDLVIANNRNSQSAVSVLQNLGIIGAITTNSFLARIDFPGSSAPEGLAVGDIDGDGKLDIVAGSPNGQTVSVYRNISTQGTINSGSFSPSVNFSGGAANSVGLADMDGDGRIDITSTSGSPGIFSIFKNISVPGTFMTNSLATRVDFSAGSNPNGVALGDLNGDGRPEAVFVNFYDDTLSIYQDITPIIGAPAITSQPSNLTVFISSNATFTVSVLGNAPLSYQWHFNKTNDLTAGTNATLTLTNVQFSDAGDYSVTVTNSSGSTTSSNATLYVNQLPFKIPVIETFTPTSGKIGDMITLGGSNFSAVASDDFVFFGAVRAIVNVATTSNLVVIVPSGATFAPITLTVGGLTAFTDQQFVPTFPGIGNITISSLTGRVDLGTASGPSQAAIADLDGDGKSDILVGDAAAGKISVFRNISTNGSLSVGSFAPRIDLSMGSAGGANPYRISVGDLDGDGKIDIVAINADNKLVSIFRNLSHPGTIDTNSFDTRIDLPGGNLMRGIGLGDLDGDGKLDIVAANTGDSTVSVFRNQSFGANISFAARVNFPTAIGTFGVGIADVDGDGKREIISVNNGAGAAGTVSILKNAATTGVISNNSFLPHVDFPGDSSGESLVIGDLDKDGKLDLVVGSPAATAIFIYRNTSTKGIINTSSFASEVSFGAPGAVNFLALADIDGDGKIDLAAVCQAIDTLTIFKNISTPGTFTTSSLSARVNFPAGSNPNGVTVGDLDGDGRPEVVFNNFYDSTLSIYRNVIPIGQSPVITVQPTNLTASVGRTADFAVGAVGTAPLSFQWFFNTSNSISGGTNSSLTLTNIVLSNAGIYSVTVSNQFGSVTSSNATLTVTGLDHFDWSFIPTPRFVNSPFAVTIVAEDITNAIFTNFTGTVSLSSTNGGLVSPQVSENFVGGVWNGAIAVPQLTSGLVLKASDGAGHVGLANSFDVVSLPALGTLNFGTSLLVSWPAAPSGFVLESSTDLFSGTWTLAPGSPISFNGQNLQSVPFSNTNQFFRLRFLGP